MPAVQFRKIPTLCENRKGWATAELSFHRLSGIESSVLQRICDATMSLPPLF
jgi:hypothetical protein